MRNQPLQYTRLAQPFFCTPQDFFGIHQYVLYVQYRQRPSIFRKRSIVDA